LIKLRNATASDGGALSTEPLEAAASSPADVLTLDGMFLDEAAVQIRAAPAIPAPIPVPQPRPVDPLAALATRCQKTFMLWRNLGPVGCFTVCVDRLF
jgi:hypothetical protein